MDKSFVLLTEGPGFKYQPGKKGKIFPSKKLINQFIMGMIRLACARGGAWPTDRIWKMMRKIEGLGEGHAVG